MAAEVDHAEELIDSIVRQLSTDSGGEDYVQFARGDGRWFRVPTFHTELLHPYLERIAPFGVDGGQPVPPELEAEREQVEQQRAERIRAWLEANRALVEKYVEGD